METQNIYAIGSLLLMLLFAELSAACLKRIAPFLSAWIKTQSDGESSSQGDDLPPTWGRIAILAWSIGGMVPILAFSLATILFLPSRQSTATDLSIGAMIGGNVIALGLLFGLILYSSRLTFFRIRTMSSPIFLFLGTFAFILVTLDAKISMIEGIALWGMALAYSFYFRAYSSDWRYYQRHSNDAAPELAGGFLPILAIVCMALGFFTFAVLVAYPFLQWLVVFAGANGYSDLVMGTNLVALLLAFPWIIRVLFTLGSSATQKAINVTNITHTCFLNLMFLPGVIALVAPIDLSADLLRVDLPVLLFFTGVFAATLLIEKQQGRALPGLIVLTYFVYLATGVLR